MGIGKFFKSIAAKINKSKPVVAVKAQIQTNIQSKKNNTIQTVAGKVGSELITPETTSTGAPVTVVSGSDYRRAGSTAHVRESELSGIYFNDVLEFELESSLRTQYRNAHISEYVMVPAANLNEVLSYMSEAEIQDIKDKGYLVYDEHGKPTMTVDKYRTWQQTREVQVRNIEPEGLTTAIKTIKGMTFASASTCNSFYLDDADTLRIAENYGGGTKGVLNDYAHKANIPVPILAVCAIMSVVDKEGNPVPLVNSEGSITRETYLAVRKALNGDPLVGFLDDFTGYSVDEKGNIKPGRKEHFGNTSIPLTHLHGGLVRIVREATEGFKISPEGYGTSYAFRANATKIDSQCDSWINDAVAEYEEHPERVDRALIDMVQLNEAAAEFASGMMRDDSQVKYINRRQRNLLRTVLGNQTDYFKNTVLPDKVGKYEEIFNGLTGDFANSRGVVGENSHKFTEPKPFDESRYTADYAMLKDNILLVNSVQLGLSNVLESLDSVDLTTDDAATAYITNELHLTSEQIATMARKYEFDLTASTPRERVEKVIELQTKDQIAQIIGFNQAVIDLVSLKEDLRVCEHTMGQFKFKNLTAVEDMHKLAVERIKAQQNLIIKERKEKIDTAKKEIATIKDKKAKAIKEVKTLTTQINGHLQSQEKIAEGIIGGPESAFFTVLTTQIARISARNGKGFDTKNPSFKKLLDSHMTRILKNEPIKDAAGNVVYESIYNVDGTINQDALTVVVQSAVSGVLTANQARAEGLKPGEKPRTPVPASLVSSITASIVDGIMADPENTTLKSNATSITELIEKRKGIQQQIDGAEGVPSFDAQIAEQESIISTEEKAIKGIKNTPEEQRQLVNAEKQYYGDLATVKGAEFVQVIKTLTEMVDTHTENMDTLIAKGVFARDENGKLIIPESSIIRTLADANNPQILTDFEAGLATYGEDSAKLLSTLSDKIEEIKDVAFKDFDIIIEVKDGKVVGEPRHIDNPTRVKGDIDPRIMDLYEHQSQIDVYREIMNPDTEPGRRVALISKLPANERVALGVSVDGSLPADTTQMNTFLDGRIQAELEASDKVRLAYAEMKPEEQIKFQRDYVRYEHYVTRNYIDAAATSTPLSAEESTVMVDDGVALDELFKPESDLAKEAAAVGDKLGEVSYKEMSRPKVKTRVDVPEEEDTSETTTVTPPRRERDYSDDAVAFQEAFDNRSFIEHIKTPGMTNENRLATVQAFSEKFPDRAEFFSSLITPEGAVVEGVAGIAAQQEATMTTIAATKGELTDPKCTTFVQEVVSKHFAELDEQGVEYSEDDVAAYTNEIEDSIAKQQQQVEDKKKGKMPKNIKYTASGCKSAIKALSKTITKLEEKIQTDKAAAAAAEQQAQADAAKKEAYERGLLEKGYLDMVANTTKPILATLTAPQIMAIVDKSKVTISGETLDTWKECVTGKDGVVDEKELLEFVESELGINGSEVEVIGARQLQTISDPSVVVTENGQIVNASGINVAGALYDRIDNASQDTELTSLEGRDAVLYTALRGVADRTTTQIQVDTMMQLFKDNGIEITPENVSKFVSGELTITTPATATTPEVKTPMNAGIQTGINNGLTANGLTPKTPVAGDSGMGGGH